MGVLSHGSDTVEEGTTSFTSTVHSTKRFWLTSTLIQQLRTLRAAFILQKLYYAVGIMRGESMQEVDDP